MSLDVILTACTQAGVILRWDGTNIKAYGQPHILSKLLPVLRNYKAELCAYFEEDAREYFEERAAIAEYEGGMTRAEAESQVFAEMQVRNHNLTIH